MAFTTVLSPMVSLFLLILMGTLCVRMDWIDDKAISKISLMIINIFNPCMMFSGALSANSIPHSTLLMVLLIALGIFVLFGILGTLTCPLFDREKSQQNMYKLMFMFSNLGFIGIPVVRAVLGDDYVVYVSEFLLVYNLFFYTYAMAVMDGSFSLANLKKMVNIGTVASLITILVVWFRIPVPDTIGTAVSLLGGCTSPLAMILVGVNLYRTGLKEVFCSLRLYLFSLCKLLVLPIALIPVLRLIGLEEGILALCVIMIGMPVGNMSLILGTQKGIDCGACSASILLSTLLSVVTLPIVALFL